MKILAIDLGTKMGWALGYAGRLPDSFGTKVLAKPTEISKFVFERTNRTGDPRMVRAWSWSKEICRLEQPNVVIWEDVPFTTFTFQSQLWSSYRTCLQLAALNEHNKLHPLVFECVPARSLKKFAGAAGSDKKYMKEQLLKTHPELNLNGYDDNAVDAIWLFKWADYFLARTFEPGTLKRI